MLLPFRRLLLVALLSLGNLLPLIPCGASAPFVAVDAKKGTVAPVVVHTPNGSNTEEDWEELSKTLEQDRFNLLPRGIKVFREVIQKMTGETPPVVAGPDVSQGIVLVLMEEAPAEIRKDPEIIKALASTGEDTYNANEAFYIRTDPKRTLLLRDRRCRAGQG
jgi:hypothetical protein